ncbi:UDP-4-amino-4,6-dideoxy-N-acetyl-beta-L-altrosamine N-acetyltransferase [Pseudomonas sp.]|uniref:UDP-4-amino-4, 6-dideoxy-N-acetyl-beta-L-altrosamine N-acetyltransferase n=1 Tax=Pseudomonas sp. TaxID=306 RepID=UPI002C7DB82C|nr:UDP-4-amino-4,6-dideoxy-N-acetyl-beta-L-altrosamine N-acetyltransferase [Pseudomonas sp.]HUE91255.1 UDP-4-amino-4,6-dideoxy-N-acetyl-beta-L-altrosamine N-acetyltransferase [Pseudomonas sp.]
MSTPNSRFVPLSAELLEVIRVWRNSPRISDKMLSNQPISAAQQQSWFVGLEGDTERRYLVFCQEQTPVGMLYFTAITPARCSWGCYIGAEAVWPGSGLLLEVAALDYAFDRLGVDCLHAEVLDFNLPPQRMHKVFGYRLVTTQPDALQRNGQQHALLHYEYACAEWQANRDKVIASLPRQIREGIARISFTDY